MERSHLMRIDSVFNAVDIHLADAKIDEQFELLSDPYVFQHTVAAVSPLQETMSEFKSQHD